MGQEIDLLKNYPKTKRNLDERAAEKTEEDRAVARKFGKDFFDGDRKHGYGGFNYMSRFWTPVIPDFQHHWDLTTDSSVLDVGCAKGFMLYDLKEKIPGIIIAGVDVSEYAIENSKLEVKEFLKVADARELPFDNNSFDVVIAINTVHNLELDECTQAIKEIQRVSKRGAFITVDAYHNEEEKQRMDKWNLTAKTILSAEDWKSLFAKVGYTGDYYWFIP